MSRLCLFDRTGLRVSSLRVALAFCGVVATSSIELAMAADWPLRGSLAPTPTYVRWDGWQAGVLGGYGNMNNDFGNSTSSLVGFILRNSTLESEGAVSTWTTLPANTTNGFMYGGFVGYNMQWDQLVLGFDFAYKRGDFNSTTASALARRFDTSDNIQHNVLIMADSSLKLIDYATLRARAGYAIDHFLPYAVLGIAAGRFNYLTTVTVTDDMTLLVPLPPTPLGTFQDSATAGKTNSIVAGIVAGLGVDWAITPAVFLRAEWEFIAFAPVNGARTNLNTGQLGLGFRF